MIRNVFGWGTIGLEALDRVLVWESGGGSGRCGAYRDARLQCEWVVRIRATCKLSQAFMACGGARRSWPRTLCGCGNCLMPHVP